MAEVSLDMILDYLARKGGVVRNVDLVRHFKKYLQFESEQEKDRARVIFKERVNKVAFIKADSKQEKYLHLRSEFYPPGGLTRPPTGRSVAGSDHSSSVSSLEDGGTRSAAENRFSFSSVPGDLKSPGPESDLVFNSIKASPSPVVTTIPPAQQQQATPSSAHQHRTTSTSSQLQRAAPPPARAAPPPAPQRGKTRKMDDDDFGASLMAELNSFGSILDSFDAFGITSSSSAVKSPPPSSTSSMSASYSTPAVGASTSSYTSGSTGYSSTTPNSYSSSSSNLQKPAPKAAWSSPPHSSSATSTPVRSAVHPTTTKSSSVSPQKTSYSSAPQKTSFSSYDSKQSGRGQSSDMDFDLGSVLSSLPSATGAGVAKKPAAVETSRKAASGDMDLSDVLSSLPSAKGGNAVSKKPANPSKKPASDSMDLSDLLSGLPSAKSAGYKSNTTSSSSVGNSVGTRQQYGRAEPPKPQPTAYQSSSNQPLKTQPNNTQPAYQSGTQPLPPNNSTQPPNSARFDQLKAQSVAYQNSIQTPLQNSYQNSTRFDQPTAQPSYQNSTRFDQPQLSYQNSTRFDQPKSQPSYQNSTRFDQPQQQQPSYQNSTRFDQPKAQPSYQNSTRFDQPKAQPSYQNSTRFDQPKAQPSYQNSTRFDQPKAQPSYQNNTRYDQPNANQASSYQHSFTAGGGGGGGGGYIQPGYQAAAIPRYDPLSDGKGVDHIRALQPNARVSPQPSARGEQTQQNSAPQQNAMPPAGISAGGPIAPARTSSISQKSRDSHSGPSRRAAPPPPQATPQATPDIGPSAVVFSPRQAASPSPFQSSLGGLDMGDFSTSLFSTTTGSTIDHAPNPAHLTTPAVTDPTPSSTHHTRPATSSNAGPNSTHHISSPAASAPNSTHHLQPAATVGASDTTQTSPPYSRKLGPAVSLPPLAGGRGPRSQVDGRQGNENSRRQPSTDSQPGTPAIKIESPAVSSAESGSPSRSRRGRSPPHDNTSRGRTSSGSSGSITMATAGMVANASLGVQLRNRADSKATRSQSAARRSKNLDKNANLDSFTRLSISMTPPAARKHRPPEVAPKPLRTASPGSSYEDGPGGSAQDGEDDHSEYEYEEIDPLEKEWMLASAQADIDGLQRLMMTDSTLLNRKGFLHGYTALHWAAKHGRMDILSMLLMQGAITDIKSGLTPLHLAAQAGHDNILEVLISQHNANINLRENGGRRAIDMVNNKCSERVKGLLSHLHNHGLPIRVVSSVMPASFSRSRREISSLDRNWKSLSELTHSAIDKDKVSRKKHHLSPGSVIKKSFSFKKSNKVKEGVLSSPKRKKKTSRPVSDAATHRYNV